MAQAIISSIDIPASFCPVIEFVSGVRKCHYQKNVWQLYLAKGSGAVTSATPVALIQGQAKLSVNITFPVGASKRTFEIHVLLSNSEISNVAVTTPKQLRGFSNTQTQANFGSLALLAPKVQGIDKAVPWAFTGTLSFQLNEVKTTGTTLVEAVKMPVEIYVLSEKLPDLYLNAGVPLALLRLETLIPAWLRTEENDWPAFVVRALFNDERLEYHVVQGISKYTCWETSGMGSGEETYKKGEPITIDCWLDLWLSDMNGLTARGDKSNRYSVDCYDVAAISQAIMFIGTDPTKLRLKYMEPFGYINPIKLIGIKEANPAYQRDNPENLCNNPLFGSLLRYNPRVLCPQMDPDRSAFGNHMFLTYDKGSKGGPMVLDACAGPHAGDLNLEKYCKAGIDSERGGAKYSGKAKDAYDGPGVSILATTALFAGQARKQTGIVDALSARLNGRGVLQEPYLGSVAYYRTLGITMTWTFTVRSKSWLIFPRDDLITINIFGYKDPNGVRDQWNLRQVAIPDFQPDSEKSDSDSMPTKGFSNSRDGSIYMFRIPEKYWLAVLTSQYCKSAALKQVAQLVEEALNSLPLPETAPAMKVTETIVEGGSKISIGSEFNLRIHVNGTDGQYWRGYQVNTPTGPLQHVLLRDADIDENQNVVFQFVARKAGVEDILLTLFDVNFNKETIKQTVNVSA